MLSRRPIKVMEMNGLVLRMILGILTSYCAAVSKFNNHKLHLKTADLWRAQSCNQEVRLT